MPQPANPDPATIKGHPAVELDNGGGDPVVITVCANCGAMRSVLWLTEDRWYCNQCRAQGAAAPTLYPVA